MIVDFFTGVFDQTGGEVIAYWARTDSGDTAILDSAEETFRIKDRTVILKEETVTSIDLVDFDQDLAQTIINTILTRGYLKKPGIKDKGEAVLFVLVNEALPNWKKSPVRKRSCQEPSGNPLFVVLRARRACITQHRSVSGLSASRCMLAPRPVGPNPPAKTLIFSRSTGNVPICRVRAPK